jgi:hypothetical protein
MALDPTKIEQSAPGDRPRAKDSAALDHATALILRVCHLAGSASFVDGTGPDYRIAKQGRLSARSTGDLLFMTQSLGVNFCPAQQVAVHSQFDLAFS